MKFAALIVAVLLIGGGLYYHYFYPPALMERATEKALQQFVDAVDTKDRAKISDALRAYLADDAAIHLEVGFFSLTQQNKMTEQNFDRESFVTFIDNVLYSMTDYGYEASLDQFTPAPDRSTADVTWRSLAWSDGASYFGGVGVNMRFSGNPECSGKVTFKDIAPKLAAVNCKMVIQMVPKPGEEQKLQQNPGALNQYLR